MFLWTENQLREHGLIPAGGCCALIESQYGPAALYLITETALADPSARPPARPTDIPATQEARS